MSEPVRELNPSFITAEVMSTKTETRVPDPSIPPNEFNRPEKYTYAELKILSCKTVQRLDFDPLKSARPFVGEKPGTFPPHKEITPAYKAGDTTGYYYYLPDGAALKPGDRISARTPEMSSYMPSLFDLRILTKGKPDRRR